MPVLYPRSYGNKEGLLMGVALEIMLVLVCQLYPNLSEFDILHNFFHVFAKWPWADKDKGIVNIKGALRISFCYEGRLCFYPFSWFVLPPTTL